MRMQLIVGSLISLSIGCSASPAKTLTPEAVGPNGCLDMCVPILQKHVACLRRACNNSCLHQLIDPLVFVQDNSPVSYKHELTRLSLKKISTEKDLSPLFESWDIFLKSYRKIESDLFIYEFSIELFFLYKNILSQYPELKVSIGQILLLSAQITSLPLDQLLTTLERCYHQFMIILGQHGMAEGVSLAVWIRQYWWVPPVVIISFAYSALKHYLLPKASDIIGLPGIKS